jgi:hypothetical protein
VPQGCSNRQQTSVDRWTGTSSGSGGTGRGSSRQPSEVAGILSRTWEVGLARMVVHTSWEVGLARMVVHTCVGGCLGLLAMDTAGQSKPFP